MHALVLPLSNTAQVWCKFRDVLYNLFCIFIKTNYVLYYLFCFIIFFEYHAYINVLVRTFLLLVYHVTLYKTLPKYILCLFQLNMYGGILKYRISYEDLRRSSLSDVYDVIIKGAFSTTYCRAAATYVPGRDVRISLQMIEDFCYQASTGSSADIRVGFLHTIHYMHILDCILVCIFFPSLFTLCC